MAIDRIHWKVGDWVLVSSKGFNQIEAIDDEGVSFTVDRSPETHVGRLRKFPYNAVYFKGVAESKDWKRGDLVYVDGIHPTVIGYICHERWGCVNYIEWNGDWDSAYGSCLTAKPLDPELVHKAELRDWRLEYEAFQARLAEVMAMAPAKAKLWGQAVQDAFSNEFEEQLKGERNE